MRRADGGDLPRNWKPAATKWAAVAWMLGSPQGTEMAVSVRSHPAAELGSSGRGHGVLGASRFRAFGPPPGQPCQATPSVVQSKSACLRAAFAASKSPSPRHTHSAKAGAVQGPAGMQAQPLGANAAVAANAEPGGSCGAKSQSSGRVGIPWAAHAATAATKNPPPPRCAWQPCPFWHRDSGKSPSRPGSARCHARQ